MPRPVAAGPSVSAKSRDRGAVVGLRRVPEGFDQRVALERLLNDTALNPLAAAMNEANFVESGFVRGIHVLFDDGPDVSRREGMKIERAFDRNAVGHKPV